MKFEEIQNLHDLNDYLLESSDNVNTFITSFEDEVNWYEAQVDCDYLWFNYDFEKELNSSNSLIETMDLLKMIINQEGTHRAVIGDTIVGDEEIQDSEHEIVREFLEYSSFTKAMQEFLEEQNIEFDEYDFDDFLYNCQDLFKDWLYDNKTVIVGDDRVVNEVLDTPIHLLFPISWEYDDMSDPDNEFAKQFKDLEGTEFNVDVPGVLFKCTLNEFDEIVKQVQQGNDCIITNSNIKELYIPECGFSGGSYLINKHDQQLFYPIGDLDKLYTITSEECWYGDAIDFRDIKGFIKKDELEQNIVVSYGVDGDVNDYCRERYIKSVTNSMFNYTNNQQQYISEIIENTINQRSVDDYIHIFESDHVNVLSENVVGSTFGFDNMPKSVEQQFVDNVRNNFSTYPSIEGNLNMNLQKAYNTEILKILREHLEVLENGLELSKNQPKENKTKSMKM